MIYCTKEMSGLYEKIGYEVGGLDIKIDERNVDKNR